MQLKRAGANFAACCPFHSEKTPSFTVSPTKQFYHCFGCGAHGTAIGFLMEYRAWAYVDAVKDWPACGMRVPEDARPSARTKSPSRRRSRQQLSPKSCMTRCATTRPAQEVGARRSRT